MSLFTFNLILEKQGKKHAESKVRYLDWIQTSVGLGVNNTLMPASDPAANSYKQCIRDGTFPLRIELPSAVVHVDVVVLPQDSGREPLQSVVRMTARDRTPVLAYHISHYLRISFLERVRIHTR